MKVSEDKLDSYYVYCQDEHLLEILIQKYIVNQKYIVILRIFTEILV